MGPNHRVSRWIVLGAAGTLVLGTVSLAQGSNGSGPGGTAARSVVALAGPVAVTEGQRTVLWATNIGGTARQVGMKLFDQSGRILAQARPTIAPGGSRSIIAILIGLAQSDANRGPAAVGAVRARIAFLEGDPDQPIVVGGIYVQDGPSGASGFIDGTSNTIMFGEASTQVVHSTQGDSARVMVANLGRSAASFTAVAMDEKGNAVAKKSLRQIAPGGIGTATFAMGDGSVRFVVDGPRGAPYDASTQLDSAAYLLPYIEQQN